ncbi:TniQ family protein [Paraburkholderia sp. EG287A]|uniref:TniQ family protein n=1 Tax=unclassified Paraburkholderia TaxID=2615204 RepID=UPI0034D1A796
MEKTKERLFDARSAFRTEPVELSSARRQKLTDYVIQMASEALLPVEAIVGKMLQWPSSGAIEVDKSARHPFASGQCLSLVNACGTTAQYWVRRVNHLSGRTDLDALTLLPFRDVLRDPHGLVQRGRRWCPQCLQADLVSGSIVYERLLWAIRMVTWCPIHNTPLTGRCAICGYEHRSEMYRRSLSGFCTRCHGWLGHRQRCRFQPALGDQTSIRELWIAEQLASMLEISAEDLRTVSSGNLSRMLELGIGMTCGGNARSFAELLGKSPSSLAEWRAGLVYPSVSTLLCMSRKFGIPFRAWLTGDLTAWESRALRRQLKSDRRIASRPEWTGREWPEIERRLRAIAADDGYFLSWEKTAQFLKIDPSQLRGKYPDLARKIATKARENRARMSAVRREMRKATLRQHVGRVVRDLLDSGIEPTRRRVECELISQGIKFRWADYPLILQAKREIGRASIEKCVNP